jgi:hypothetical protein
VDSIELHVTFGKAWYKLVAVSVLLGSAVAAGTYLTGCMVFKDTFGQVTAVPT